MFIEKINESSKYRLCIHKAQQSMTSPRALAFGQALLKEWMYLF